MKNKRDKFRGLLIGGIVLMVFGIMSLFVRIFKDIGVLGIKVGSSVALKIIEGMTALNGMLTVLVVIFFITSMVLFVLFFIKNKPQKN